METKEWLPPHLSKQKTSGRKSQDYQHRKKSSEGDEESDISDLLEWILNMDDDWDHYDVHVSGETVTMRGGMGG